MKNFDQLGIAPSSFNAIVRPLAQMEQKKSDHNNGYYIVADTWGTCFLRISKNIKHFEIRRNKQPTHDHTYTRIPGNLIDKIFFVYCNFAHDKGFKLILQPGDRVVGTHEPTASAGGKWWNQTALIYSPIGEAPTVEEIEYFQDAYSLIVQKGEDEAGFSIDDIMKGFPVRYIHLNEEGYEAHTTKTLSELRTLKWLVENYRNQPATQSIGL